MKIIIIEDEYPASRKLERLLSELYPEIELLGTLTSVIDATNWLSSNTQPDLIFMDIQLEDGLCFEIFDNIEINTPVIFTTAFDKYAIDAFKVNSVDYLLKPIELNELQKAIRKYKTFHATDIDKINKILDRFTPKSKERFLIRVGEHYKSIPVKEIHCFFISERCNFINTGKNNNYAIDYSLDRIEQMVSSKDFFRVNRNVIVNYNAIHDITSYSTSRLKITVKNPVLDEDIIVSRERVASFKAWMDR